MKLKQMEENKGKSILISLNNNVKVDNMLER